MPPKRPKRHITSKKACACPDCGETPLKSKRVSPPANKWTSILKPTGKSPGTPVVRICMAPPLQQQTPATVTKPADKSSDPGSSCGYCLEDVDKMADPRAMPCGHFFCRPCLEADNRNLEVIKCAVCRWNLDSTDVLKLPKVPQYPQKGASSSTSQTVKCDVCDGGAQLSAVKFCMDCYKKMCASHAELHDDYHAKFGGSKHNCIDIDDYVEDSPRFSQQMCTKHDSPQTLSCSNCMRIFCDKCDDTDADCTGAQGTSATLSQPHRLGQIKKHSTQLVNDLKVCSNKLSQREEVMAKLDKSAWAKFESLDKEVQSMLQSVDDSAMEQWEKICIKRDALKSKVSEYQLSNAKRVEEYSERLNRNIDGFTEARTKIHELVKMNSSDIITKYDQVVTKTNIMLKRTEDHVVLQSKTLQSVKNPSSCCEIDMELVLKLPTAITLDRGWGSRRHGSDMQAVRWTNQGELVIGSRGRMYAHTKHTIELIDKPEDLNVISMTVLSNGDILALCEKSVYSASYPYVHQSWVITRHDANHVYKGVFAKLWKTSAPYDLLSSNDELVAVTREGTTCQSLILYDQNGKSFGSCRFGRFTDLSGLAFVGARSVVVSDEVYGKVARCDVSATEATDLWTNSSITNPKRLSADSSGHVYVSLSEPGPIYVLSATTGDKICKLVADILMFRGITLDDSDSQTDQPSSVFKISDLHVAENKVALVSETRGLVVFDIVR